MDQWVRQSFISGFHVNIGFWMPIDWWLTKPLSNSPYHSDSLRWDGGSYERIPSKHIQKLHTLSRCWIDHTRIIYFWNEIKNGEGGNAIICFKQLCCNDKGKCLEIPISVVFQEEFHSLKTMLLKTCHILIICYWLFIK